MISKTNTVNMDPGATPRETAPKHITPLSPGIDNSSSLLRLEMSVTPDNKIPNKKALPEIRKFLKTDHGKKYLLSKGIHKDLLNICEFFWDVKGENELLR